MTTGRINQIAKPCGLPGAPRPPKADQQPPAPRPPIGGPECSTIWKGRSRRPATARMTPAYRGPACGHPFAPTESPPGPVRTQGTRHGALSGSDGLRHAALGWGVQTPRSRRRTAATAGRLPPGIWVSTLASGHGPTDSSDAGDTAVPGLRSPRSRAPTSMFTPAAHPDGTATTASAASASGVTQAGPQALPGTPLAVSGRGRWGGTAPQVRRRPLDGAGAAVGDRPRARWGARSADP